MYSLTTKYGESLKEDSHWIEDSSWSLSCHELLLFQVEALLRQQEVSTSSSNVEALCCVSQKISKIGPNECLLFGA